MDFENTFMKKYISQVIEGLKLSYPEKSEEELLIIVKRTIKKKEKENLNKKPKYKVSTRDAFGVDTDSDMLTIINYLEDEKPIITGFGAIYHQHVSDVQNILLEMVQMLLDIRSIYKQKKIAHANDIDKTLMRLYDKYQLAYKLLNNSFFGAAGQPQSIFFDPYFPSAIMYTGQIIIMTAITTFEKLTGNFCFTKYDDCILYMNRILNQKYTTDLNIDIHYSKEDLFNLLKSKFEGISFNEKILMKTIDSFTQEQIDRLYYKNNILDFIENSQIKDLLDKITEFTFLDVNHPSKELFPIIQKFWLYVKEYCMYEYIPVNRTDFCKHHERKTVLTVN